MANFIFGGIRKFVYVLVVIGLVLSSGVVASADENSQKYRIRCELLLDAIDHVGVGSPEEAVVLWMEGLESRNAAMQYAVMNTELKKRYLVQLEKNIPNWVTGMSSPWVDSYLIKKAVNIGKDKMLYKLAIATVSSAGPGGTFEAVLTICRESNFWRITDIKADVELYPYMGFELPVL